MSIAELVEQLEAEFVGGNRLPGTSRRLININDASRLIEALRTQLPEEIAEAQGIVRQKEGILKQAELEARRMRQYADEEATSIRETAEEKSTAAMDAAQQQAIRMIEETEVLRAAERRAEEIIANAEEKSRAIIDVAEEEAGSRIAEADAKIGREVAAVDAEISSRREGADEYSRERLFALEQHLADMLGQVRKGIDVLDPDLIIAN